jgi:Protein of unknown function (DUF3987)
MNEPALKNGTDFDALAEYEASIASQSSPAISYKDAAVVASAYHGYSIDDMLAQARRESEAEKKTMSRDEEIWHKAGMLHVSPARVAIDDCIDINLAERRWWFEPKAIAETSAFVSKLNLINGTESPLVDMCKAVAAEVQFPLQTTYIHALGVIASLSVRHFKVAYWNSGTIPVNLYVVTSQPPSTGKSGVNNALTEHARIVISEKNEKNRASRDALRSKIEKKKKELDKAESDGDAEQIYKELMRLEEHLKIVNAYRYGLNDVTAEKAEDICASQGGVFTIVSAESFGIKTVLGDVYKNPNSTPNQNLFLSAWDGEYISSARITREGYEGYAACSIAVLAQDGTFDSILNSAGKDSCGVSERFLLGREPTLIGKRKSSDRVPVPYEIKKAYHDLVDNILEQGPITLTMSSAALRQISMVKDFYDDESADGKRYANDIMRGIVGKADKQIHKIASVLHIVNNWKKGGEKKTEIGGDTVFKAFNIFKDCTKIYEAIADNRGITGKNTNRNLVIERVKKIANDQKGIKLKIKLATLRDATKNLKQLKRENFTEFLRKDILPELEAMHYLAFDSVNDLIYINPILRD